MSQRSGPHGTAIPVKGLRHFRSGIRTLERELGLHLKDQTTCCGVTMAQCHALLELDSSGTLTVSGLAKTLGLDKSTLSRTLDSLAAAALVERTPDPDDRRALNVALTEKGQAVARRINDECDAYYRKLFQRFSTAQREKVLEAVEILAEAMRASARRLAPCCPERSHQEGEP